MLRTKLIFIFTLFVLTVFAPSGFSAPLSAEIQNVTLDDCLQQALEHNHLRPASQYAVAIAEAQHRQALSAYWPQFNATGGYKLNDEDPNYIFPSSTIALGGSIDVSIPGVGTFPVSEMEIPEQDVKLMDKESWVASLETTWLLYDGGMRRGYSEQTSGLVEMAKQQARRTDLEIIDTVKRYYYGAVLAKQLHIIGKQTFERMEATLSLTETMYKEGSGTVKKTDWLDNKIMVETIRSMVAQLEKNELLSQAALANAIGLPWHISAVPTDTELPFTPLANQLNEMVSSAYQFSPDWGVIEAAIRAAEGAIMTAKSGHSPQIGFSGELYKWWNDYDGGLATAENEEGWKVGVGVTIPLFSGGLTRHKVAEAKARVAQLKEQKFLLKEGIGLQLRDAFLSLTAAEKTYKATQSAMSAATENRDLNTRAYQHSLVETEKVIRAQLIEALMSAQHYKSRYDHIALQSKLNLIVGTEREKQTASH
jgi:outer membrane protein TolC